MNASDWKKAAALIGQQQGAAATVQTDQLSSLPLNALSMDDSSLSVVQYGSHASLATSIPARASLHEYNPQQEDTYQEIISGIPQSSLYSTLAAIS